MPQSRALLARRIDVLGTSPYFWAGVLSLLLLTACGGGAGPDPAAEAAKTAAPEASAGTGAPPTLDLPPPPLAPALNRYTEDCTAVGPPAPDGDVHRYAAVCFSTLLEVLRVSLMPAGLTPEDAGAELDAAEVAVNRLGLRQGEGLASPAARAATAATLTTDLMAALVTAVEEGSDAAVEEVRVAALAVDDEAPLSAQGEQLAAYFAAADRAVRPVVRSL